MNLVDEIFKMNEQLRASVGRLKETGTALAEAEKKYRIELHKQVLILKEEKQPATLINLIIYGVPSVAELRFKRDIAETIYNTNLEHINATKLQIKILENQVSREWNNA